MYTVDVINQFADLVRVSLELSCPYDPELAVSMLGGEIDQTVDDMAVDAYITKKGTDSFRIDLNSKKPFLRERFTLAHELGHLFLHMGFLVNKKKWDSLGSDGFTDSVYFRSREAGTYSRVEFEASEFAASFLMPRSEFRDQVYGNLSNDCIDIQAVARYFGVSFSAALSRARRLGYVDE